MEGSQIHGYATEPYDGGVKEKHHDHDHDRVQPIYGSGEVFDCINNEEKQKKRSLEHYINLQNKILKENVVSGSQAGGLTKKNLSISKAIGRTK